MTDKQAVERLKKALMSYLFDVCQPDRGDVFGWFDDHADEAIAFMLARSSEGAEPDRWQYLEPHEQEALATKIATNIGYRLVSDLSTPSPRVSVEEIRAALEPFAALARVRYPEEGGAPSWIDLMTEGDQDELELRSHTAASPISQILDAEAFRQAERLLARLSPAQEGEGQ